MPATFNSQYTSGEVESLLIKELVHLVGWGKKVEITL